MMSAPHDLTVVRWNTEWTSRRSHGCQIVRGEMRSVDPDVICLADAVPGMMRDHGHAAVSRAHPVA